MKRRQERREVAVYNGQDQVGTIVIQGRKFTALDASGRRLGGFDDQKSAACAVIAGPKAADEARNRVLGPVAYTSGLPEHFLTSNRHD
jgi:hypothetical protein